MFDASHIALYVCAASVIVGVLLEGHEHLEEHRQRGWQPVVPKLGFGLLVIGLAGEFVLGIRIGQSENRARIAAEESISKLNLEAARLRADNLALEKLVNPRSLSGEQLLSLAEKAHPFAGQAARVTAETYDQEAYWLALQLISVLEGADWNVTREFIGMAVRTQPVAGIAMRCSRPDPKSESAMTMLVKELKGYGLTEVTGDVAPADPANLERSVELLIVVNSKPLPGTRQFIIKKETR